MEKVVNFIVENWQFISIAIVVLLEITLFIIKKRPKTVLQDDGVYQDLVSLIEEAEKIVWASGEQKKNYVLDKFADAHSYASDPAVRKTLGFFIEDILSTPTKKGGPGREKDVQKSK